MKIQESALLRALPSELLVAVLEELNYDDLWACMRVCSRFREIIRDSAITQYHLQLAAAGMEDNPHNILPQAEKLNLLMKYKQAWQDFAANVEAVEPEVVRLLDGPAWEFAGGVLAQSSGALAIEFRQLPSSVRGVEGKVWTVDLEFPISDFTMDPGQDLLVCIQSQRRTDCRTRFLSMSAGTRHPKAKQETATFERPKHNRPALHEIRISGEFVGVLIKQAQEQAPWCHISVYEWQTGNEIFEVSDLFWSFCFIDNRYLILADFLSPVVVNDYKHRLVAVNLTDTAQRWDLRMPQCLADATQVCTLELVADPSPDYLPTPSTTVPFYVQRGDRLITLLMHVTDDRRADDYAVTFSMLSSGLAKQLTPERAGTVVPWEEWGPRTCRALCTDSFAETSWPCWVYGTKRIFQDEPQVSLLDYNRQGWHWARATGNTDRWVTETGTLEAELFVEKVTTSLPYHKTKISLHIESADAVMMSEDSIVVVKEDADGNEDFFIRSL